MEHLPKGSKEAGSSLLPDDLQAGIQAIQRNLAVYDFDGALAAIRALRPKD